MAPYAVALIASRIRPDTYGSHRALAVRLRRRYRSTTAHAHACLPMPFLGPDVSTLRRQPGRFLLRAVRAFRANPGWLLAGAVAYHALLSIVPMLILRVVASSCRRM
jgi:hypothetical protein